MYTYLGCHLNKCWDLNSRLEWYKDVDGGGYPGGFGMPHTNYFEVTLGLDYHPVQVAAVPPRDPLRPCHARQLWAHERQARTS